MATGSIIAAGIRKGSKYAVGGLVKGLAATSKPRRVGQVGSTDFVVVPADGAGGFGVADGFGQSVTEEPGLTGQSSVSDGVSIVHAELGEVDIM